MSKFLTSSQSCTCQDHIFRKRECKHMKAFNCKMSAVPVPVPVHAPSPMQTSLSSSIPIPQPIGGSYQTNSQSCTCQDHIFRKRECKHMKAFNCNMVAQQESIPISNEDSPSKDNLGMKLIEFANCVAKVSSRSVSYKFYNVDIGSLTCSCDWFGSKKGRPCSHLKFACKTLLATLPSNK